jgi:hypothetical protein
LPTRQHCSRHVHSLDRTFFRFDLNKDNQLSFSEFCNVAELAIDGDHKLPPAPSAAPQPPKAAPVDPAVRARLREAQRELEEVRARPLHTRLHVHLSRLFDGWS